MLYYTNFQITIVHVRWCKYMMHNKYYYNTSTDNELYCTNTSGILGQNSSQYYHIHGDDSRIYFRLQGHELFY